MVMAVTTSTGVSARHADLERVVLGGLVGAHRYVDPVSVAARSDRAADEERLLARPAGAEPVHHVDRRHRSGRRASAGRVPASQPSPGSPATSAPRARSRRPRFGDRDVVLVVLGEEGSALRCRHERVGGERREFDPALEDQPGFEPGVGHYRRRRRRKRGAGAVCRHRVQ